MSNRKLNNINYGQVVFIVNENHTRSVLDSMRPCQKKLPSVYYFYFVFLFERVSFYSAENVLQIFYIMFYIQRLKWPLAWRCKSSKWPGGYWNDFMSSFKGISKSRTKQIKTDLNFRSLLYDAFSIDVHKLTLHKMTNHSEMSIEFVQIEEK